MAKKKMTAAQVGEMADVAMDAATALLDFAKAVDAGNVDWFTEAEALAIASRLAAASKYLAQATSSAMTHAGLSSQRRKLIAMGE